MPVLGTVAGMTVVFQVTSPALPATLR